MELQAARFELRLKDHFKTAHSQRSVQVVFIAILRQDGISGYGETTVNTYFGIDEATIRQDLAEATCALQSFVPARPDEVHAFLRQHTAIGNFALCAIDEAAYDWYGKKQGISTRSYLDEGNRQPPLTDYTIGLASVDKMVEKLKARPWPLYKIKLGTEDDVAIVRELRKHTDAVFRVDANCAWQAEEAIANARKLKELGVEFIEQPLDPADWQGMKQVYEESVLPVIADESCQTEEDVAHCAGYFHGINIKLTKCGGLTPANRMVRQARALGMQVMGGCMNESSVGISALAQLAPQLDYLDADGTLLIANDPASGVSFDNGRIVYPGTPGNGVTLLAEPVELL